MAKGAVLSLKITGDASDAKRAFDEVDGKSGALGSSLGKLAGVAAGAFAVGAVVDFGKEAFDAAANLEQMAGSVDAVFGASAKQIDDLAAKAHTAVGLSTADYDQMASVIGSQLKNAGVPMDALAGKTDALIKQGADMSAVFGGTAADAVEALSSVMKGEFDPIEKYGVSLNQSTINAALAAKGQDKLTGAALKAAQTTAALDIVTKQTTATQGQFAAQSGTAAEKSQQLGAWFTDLKAKIGAGLLPVFVSLASFLQGIAPYLQGIFEKGGPVSDMFGKIAGVVQNQVIPVLSSLWNELAPKLVPALQEAGSFLSNVLVPAFQGVWTIISTYIVPIIKTVLTPVIEGLTSVWHSVEAALEKNKGKFQEIYDKIKPFLDFLKNDLAPFIGGALKLAFEGLSKAIGPVIDVITWILDKAGAVIGFLGKVGGFLFGGGGGGGSVKKLGAPAPLFGASRAAAPLLLGAGSSGGGGAGPSAAAGGFTLTGGGDTYNITVNGALDPVAVADQLAAMLDKRARRVGLSAAGAR